MNVENSSILAPALPNPTRVSRQIFVAYPYRLYPKTDYRKVYKELSDAFKVSFVFADEKITNLHILQKIAGYIKTSQFGIYDISNWNPNVTLELGLAFGMSERAFIAIDPARTDINEVPTDLRGMDRIQYSSYSELQDGLAKLLAQELPLEPKHDVENQLVQLREQALKVISDGDGLRVPEIAEVLGVSVGMAKLIVRPMVSAHQIEIRGTRRAARYFVKGAGAQ